MELPVPSPQNQPPWPKSWDITNFITLIQHCQAHPPKMLFLSYYTLLKSWKCSLLTIPTFLKVTFMMWLHICDSQFYVSTWKVFLDEIIIEISELWVRRLPSIIWVSLMQSSEGMDRTNISLWARGNSPAEACELRLHCCFWVSSASLHWRFWTQWLP